MDQITPGDVIDREWVLAKTEQRIVPERPVVLVVRDPDQNSDNVVSVCEFLDIAAERATPGGDLPELLRTLRPIAVIADLDAQAQDGFHVMKLTAEHDPSIPILLLTSNDQALLGAIDAVREIWGLTRVSTAPVATGIGALVDFVCQAARDAGRPRLIRV
jgi:CheY-like chemotaxis protein